MPFRVRWSARTRKERDLRFDVREDDFFFLVGIRFYRVLRADQFEKLVGATEIQFLLDAVLRPPSGDSCFCGVERAVVDAGHYGNLEMKGGVFLADFDGGQASYLLIRAVEGGDELLLVVMWNMQLQAEAYAVAFQRALPHSLGARNCIGRFFCASTGSLTMENERQAYVALCPAAVDSGVIRRDPSFVGSAHRSHIETERGFFSSEGSHFNAVNALIEAVDGGFQWAVFQFGNMENEMENEMEDGLTGLQRTGPMAFEGGGTPLR
jgi:hypothetical protein